MVMGLGQERGWQDRLQYRVSQQPVLVGANLGLPVEIIFSIVGTAAVRGYLGLPWHSDGARIAAVRREEAGRAVTDSGLSRWLYPRVAILT